MSELLRLMDLRPSQMNPTEHLAINLFGLLILAIICLVIAWKAR